MPITVIVVSLVACAISVFQIFALGNLATEAQSDLKEYTDCTELIKDYNQAQEDLKKLTSEMENDNTSLSSIAKVAKLGVKLGDFEKQADKLGCDINFEEDMESLGEEIEKEANEAEQNAEEGEMEEASKEGSEEGQ